LKVSIITATYNSAQTIRDTLDSINVQTYQDIEHIIVDGLSKDETLALVKQHGKRVSRCISEKDKGIYDALNKGIAMATGDVVGFLHSDDVFAHPQAVEHIVGAFRQQQAQAVYGDLQYVKREQSDCVVRNWKSGAYRRERLRQGWMPPHPTFYMQRRLYEQLGGFDTKLRIAADYDSMLRYLWGGSISAAYVPEVLLQMKIGGESNRSLCNLLRKSREDYTVIRQNRVGGVLTLLLKNLRKIPQFLGSSKQA